MSKRIALCLDELSCREPAAVGLDGESLEVQGWLEVFSGADEARKALRGQPGFEEAWVVSCDEVDPINLAAALKGDRPGLRVCLVASELCGSLYSRAHAAAIDEVLDGAAFVRRYSEAKQRALNESLPGAPGAAVAPSAISPAITPAVKSGFTATSPSRSGRIPTHMREEARRPLLPAPRNPRRGFLMSVVSGSGGAGKSSVAVLGALCAARRGFKTLLLDFDLQFGDAPFLAGMDARIRIDDAITHPDQLQKAVDHAEPFTVIGAPRRLESAEGIAGKLPDLIDAVIGHFDVIVANTGAAWADYHAALLERSSVALFLVDQRNSSIRACRHALELCSRCGIASVPFRFALNRCAKNAPFTSIDVSCVFQGASVFELRDGGSDVEDYLSGGAAPELLETGNDFVRSLENMMDSLLPQEAGAQPGVEVPGYEGGTGILRRSNRAGKRRRR